MFFSICYVLSVAMEHAVVETARFISGDVSMYFFGALEQAEGTLRAHFFVVVVYTGSQRHYNHEGLFA